MAQIGTSHSTPKEYAKDRFFCWTNQNSTDHLYHDRQAVICPLSALRITAMRPKLLRGSIGGHIALFYILAAQTRFNKRDKFFA